MCLICFVLFCLIAVLNMLLQEFPDKFAKAITHTTRKPRINEIPGVHYHFTTREEMEKQIKNGEFIGNLFTLSSI
jgi:guanylate kinase